MTQVNVKQAPLRYRTTWITTIIVMVFTIIASLVLWVVWTRENARRDKDAMASSIPGRPESSFDEIEEEEAETVVLRWRECVAEK